MLRPLLALLLLTFIAASGCAGSSPSPTTNPAGDQNAMLDITDFKFTPDALNVHQGSSVMWMNEGAVAHTVTFDSGGPDSGNIAAGSSYSHTFSTQGTFTYHCKIHPSMTGKLTVTA